MTLLRKLELSALLVFGGWLLPACGPAIEFLPEPPGVDRLAVLTRDEAGVLRTATPLLAAAGSRWELPVTIPEDGDAVVVGYSTTELEALLPDDLSRVDVEGLVEASGCQPALPFPPSFSIAITPDRRHIPMSDRLELTAPWLSDACPHEDPAAFHVALDCNPEPCESEMRQEGCRITLDLTQCGLGGRIVLGLPGPAGGRPCIELDPDHSCRAADPAEAWAALECTDPGRCRIGVYREVESAELVADPIAVYDVEPFQADLDASRDVQGDELFQGYLADLVVLEDRVTTAGYFGQYQRDDECSEAAEVELRSYDLESLAPIGTSSAPPCLLRLARDEGRPGFLGVYRSGGTHRIGRFDSSGRLVDSAEVSLSDGSMFFPTELRELRPGSLLVLYQSVHWAEVDQVQLAIIDSESLSLERRFGPLDVTGWEAAVDREGRIALANDGAFNSISWIHPESGVVLFQQTLRLTDNPGPIGVSFHGESDRLIVSVADEIATFRGAYVTSYSTDAVRAAAIELDLTPTRVATWPKDPSLAIAAGLSHAAGPYGSEGWVALLDPRRARFLLGAIRIGIGPTSRIRSGRDEAWLLLPWSAQIVRVGVRP